MAIDWSALGTWAAVAVALGISLRDTWERWRERTVRHLLTAARILPETGRLRDGLATVLERTHLDAHTASSEVLIEVCDTFAEMLHGMNLGHLKGAADQPGALPEEMLIPLIKALSVTDMMLENDAIQRSAGGLSACSDLVGEFEHWREQVTSIKTSLDWVVLGAEKQLESKRWRRPELWG